MKTYILKYFKENRSKPTYLIQFSKSGKWDGDRIAFLIDGRKLWQFKFKNNLRNELEKDWLWNNSKNSDFTNWKKDKPQGIKIRFNR